jgi:hypothetical protein
LALDLEQRQLLSKARLLGPGTALPVILENGELAALVAVILADVGHRDLIPDTIRPPSGVGWDYYALPLSWFSGSPDCPQFLSLYEQCLAEVRDFQTYFKCVCELHKRRRKYEMILGAQPLPTSLQVAPRALLEFGILASPALASWLTWRKWFYDIDNRSAQETGYLFEPILASALGGTPCGARGSPVRRRHDTSKGRQVDCVVDKDAYEFKLRVTIAASGQGRFAEELEFAQDCVASGMRPILLVLDPTPSNRLTDLAAAYREVGGEAHIGDAAWGHIEDRSGPTMATFVEAYVRRPINEMDHYMGTVDPLRIASEDNGSRFRITLGDYEWTVGRRENPLLDSGDNGDE